MIRPYFERAGIRLFCGDVRELLPALETEPFDLAMCDPPYGETSLAWDRWFPEWLPLCAARLKRSGSLWCFGSMRMLRETVADFDAAGLRFVQDIVWEKQNGSSFHADRFKRVHEMACQFRLQASSWEEVFKAPQTTPDATAKVVRHKSRPSHMGKRGDSTYESHDGGPRLMRSVIAVPNCHGYAENETQKPVGIVEPLVAYSCPPGGRMLVPFCGSGTDLEVAFRRGLRADAFELREQQCEVAARRIAGLLDLRGAA